MVSLLGGEAGKQYYRPSNSIGYDDDRDRLGTFMVKRYTPIRRHVNGLRFRTPYSILLSSHVSRGCSTRY